VDDTANQSLASLTKGRGSKRASSLRTSKQVRPALQLHGIINLMSVEVGNISVQYMFDNYASDSVANIV